VLKSEKGFTLVEMLIVLLIISVLILITVPNVSKHFTSIDEKGCDAYIKMVQGQVQAYKIDKKKYPDSITTLKTEGYLGKDVEATCPNGDPVNIDIDDTGNVTVSSNPTEDTTGKLENND